MKTITRISGVDCKIGRNSRTGSTVSLTIDDMDIIDVVGYFNSIKEGKEPSGRIKKIELHLIYEDDLKTPTADDMINKLDDVLQGELKLD